MQNVLLLTIDCLRADRLRHAKQHLPKQLAQLATESDYFTQAFATGPRTAESFPGILTSTYSLAFGGTWRLPAEIISVAQVLQQSGRATGAFHSNPFLSANLGYDRGFATFWDSSEQTPVTSRVGAKVMNWISSDSWLYRLLRRAARQFESSVGLSHYVRAEKVTEMAVQWLSEQEQPFFLWLHYMDMHYPYAPPEKYLRQLRSNNVNRRQQADLLVRSLENPDSITVDETQLLADLYDAGLLYIDEQIGRLRQQLTQIGRAEETLIIVTGDHGEEFLEHGEFGHGGEVHLLQDGQARIRLYDELLHVPLIIYAPTRTGQEIDEIVSLIDLPPTICDLLSIEAPDAWQGHSLVPLLDHAPGYECEGAFAEYAVREDNVRYPIVAYRTKQWKYIHDGASHQHHLYDLLTDPEEKNNCYHPTHPIAKMLQAKVKEHLKLAENSPYPVIEANLDALMVERLRNLGYVE